MCFLSDSPIFGFHKIFGKCLSVARTCITGMTTVDSFDTHHLHLPFRLFCRKRKQKKQLKPLRFANFVSPRACKVPAHSGGCITQILLKSAVNSTGAFLKWGCPSSHPCHVRIFHERYESIQPAWGIPMTSWKPPIFFYSRHQEFLCLY